MHRESFVVRIWFDQSCLPSQMRGEVQHVRTGQSRRFCGQEELLDILNDWIAVMRENGEVPQTGMMSVTLEQGHGDTP